MFKKLLNLLFRRKPKHPAIFRKMPDGGFIVAHTEEEADRYEADYLPTRLELEAARLKRIQQWLHERPLPDGLPSRSMFNAIVLRESETVQQAIRRRDMRLETLQAITTFNHPVIAESDRHCDSDTSNDSPTSSSCNND